MSDEQMSLPQLRVRTEFTFRHTFGPCARVAKACAETGAHAAAMVDPDTWGHARWLNACNKAGIKPMFGTEFTVKQPNGMAPVAWVLAERDRTADFYKFSSLLRRDGVDVEAAIAEHRPGIVFAGAALTDPDLFDYVDVNPASPLQRRRAIALHQRTGRPLVLTSDNSYPTKADYGAFMAIAARERATPQHILNLHELRAAMPELDDGLWARAVRWTYEAAERAANTLRKCPMIHFDGDLRALTVAGKEERVRLGHIGEWTDEYEQRMQRELDIIHEKKFESYFLVVSDLVQWAKQRMLVGPGRGSSAGSLVCYLLRITEVDPLVHHLLFERFIDLTRSDLPDIDIDFSDTKREQVFEYLAKRYGKEHVARIGNVNTLKPRSVMAEVGKRMGIPKHETYPVINALIEYSSGDTRYGNGLADTLETTDAGRKFMSKYPASRVMGDCEGHAWHTGVHAAGVIVSNEPVIEYCTVGSDGVAHIDKPDVDVLGLLKIDALGLRTLGVIEDAEVVTGDQLYALKLNDPAAFDVMNKRNYAGIFQFEGQSQRSVSAQVHINSFDVIDHITAISRPGPLGSGAAAAYVRRADGREQVSYMHPSMEAYLDRTLGLVLYQEQVMRIVRELGGFSWEDTTTIRKGMSSRKGEEYFNRLREKFITGCLGNGITNERAAEIWNQIKTMGGWAMNASHTCAYSVIAYWCAWMKAHHPMEYAASCLRNAKDDLQVFEVLRELDRQGIGYVAFDIDRSDVNWRVIDGQLVGGFLNLVGFGEAKSVAAVEHRRLGTMDAKLRKKIEEAEVKYQLLYPLKTKYADLYANPEAHGCRAGSRVLTVEEFPDEGDVLFVATVQSKERRDENEAVRLARRNGKRRDGQTLFADLWVLDDCGLPILARIERWDYDPIGRIAVERLEAEKDVVLIRGQRIKGYPMVKIQKIRCLTNPSALEP